MKKYYSNEATACNDVKNSSEIQTERCKGNRELLFSNSVEHSMNKLREIYQMVDKWFNNELETRISIAYETEGNNHTCPICGNNLEENDCCEGKPLVNARVCPICEERYVKTYRAINHMISYKDFEKKDRIYYYHCLNSELRIDRKNKLLKLTRGDSKLSNFLNTNNIKVK